MTRYHKYGTGPREPSGKPLRGAKPMQKSPNRAEESRQRREGGDKSSSSKVDTHAKKIKE